MDHRVPNSLLKIFFLKLNFFIIIFLGYGWLVITKLENLSGRSTLDLTTSQLPINPFRLPDAIPDWQGIPCQFECVLLVCHITNPLNTIYQTLGHAIPSSSGAAPHHSPGLQSRRGHIKHWVAPCFNSVLPLRQHVYCMDWHVSKQTPNPWNSYFYVSEYYRDEHDIPTLPPNIINSSTPNSALNTNTLHQGENSDGQNGTPLKPTF